jgi:hypothetical protein
MCGKYFPNAADKMTVRRELTALEEGLKLSHDGVQAAHKLWHLIDGSGKLSIHDALARCEPQR